MNERFPAVSLSALLFAGSLPTHGFSTSVQVFVVQGPAGGAVGGAGAVQARDGLDALPLQGGAASLESGLALPPVLQEPAFMKSAEVSGPDNVLGTGLSSEGVSEGGQVPAQEAVVRTGEEERAVPHDPYFEPEPPLDRKVGSDARGSRRVRRVLSHAQAMADSLVGGRRSPREHVEAERASRQALDILGISTRRLAVVYGRGPEGAFGRQQGHTVRINMDHVRKPGSLLAVYHEIWHYAQRMLWGPGFEDAMRHFNAFDDSSLDPIEGEAYWMERRLRRLHESGTMKRDLVPTVRRMMREMQRRYWDKFRWTAPPYNAAIHLKNLRKRLASHRGSNEDDED